MMALAMYVFLAYWLLTKFIKWLAKKEEKG